MVFSYAQAMKGPSVPPSEDKGSGLKEPTKVLKPAVQRAANASAAPFIPKQEPNSNQRSMRSLGSQARQHQPQQQQRPVKTGSESNRDVWVHLPSSVSAPASSKGAATRQSNNSNHNKKKHNNSAGFVPVKGSRQHTNNTKQRQNGRSSDKASSAPSVKILTKGKPQDQKGNQKTATSTPSTKKLPATIVTPLKSSPKKQQQQKQPQPTKSKKPARQLKSMNLGHVMSKSVSKKKSSNSLSMGAAVSTTENQQYQQPPQVMSEQDFPTLGSPTVSAAAAAAAAAHTKVSSNEAIKPNYARSNPAAIKVSKTAAASSPTKSTMQSNSTKHNAPNPQRPPTTSNHRQPTKIDTKPISAADFFAPKSISLDKRHGDEHDLLRLLQERTVYQKKGRQRVAPRKKKFTPLKKKVLQERLRQWKELNPDEVATKLDHQATNDAIPALPSCTVCIYNFVQHDEIEDDDEFEEINTNLEELASKIAAGANVYIPRGLEERDPYPVFVRFESVDNSQAAKACWDQLNIGGATLTAFHINDEGIMATNEWRKAVEAKEAEIHSNVSSSSSSADAKITLNGILNQDDFDDEDCLAESLADIKSVVEEHCKVLEIVPGTEDDKNITLTVEVGPPGIDSLLEQLNAILIGGVPVSATIATSNSIAASGSNSSTVILENVLSKDDLEDEDCLAESMSDIGEVARQFGDVARLTVGGMHVHIQYHNDDSAKIAQAINAAEIRLGGALVFARSDVAHNNESLHVLELRNLLTNEDMEETDCLEETLNDVRELASSQGEVKSVSVMEKDGTNIVRVEFLDPSAAVHKAKLVFDGMILGGEVIEASVPGFVAGSNNAAAGGENVDSNGATGDKRSSGTESKDGMMPKKPRTDDKQPLYSGDKLIPERFAEMKRVPKVPGLGKPREYASLIDDERVKPLLQEMLGELMRLQKRAVEEKNVKARKRLVMGLREVARGIRAHKVKMVVMANNLDEYGAIDEKLQEIIDLTTSESVPLFFEFTKRTLGKAIGKSIKIAVVGVQNADGAHQPFKKLASIAHNM